VGVLLIFQENGVGAVVTMIRRDFDRNNEYFLWEVYDEETKIRRKNEG
jgi:hypothetical protein